MSKVGLKTVLSVLLAAALQSPGFAAPLLTDVVSPDGTLTFEEIVFAPNTVISNQYAGQGVTFGPTVFYDPVGSPNVGDFFAPIHSGHAIGNMFGFQPGQQVVPIDIFFASPVSAASVRLVLNVQVPFTGIAKLGGVDVETHAFSLANGCRVQSIGCITVGFQGILFDQIRLTNFQFPSVRLDTIAFKVPEPGFLTAGGLLALLVLRRRATRRYH
ncbi:MAG: hypothetical protein JRH01_12925 [Deltaproteobacteria bacterium]|nr:hypothetical protein [Deltaproteobacteria bacterium]MBW2396293.1 hypothetical protein [Deltaproteobacteria bacterium]